jgi:glutaconate CoA-transferase subunit B
MATQQATLEELIICQLSLGYSGENIGVGATILSDLGARLAKLTHAPELILLGGTSLAAWDTALHPKVLNDEFLGVDSALWGLDWTEQFDMVAAGRLQIWLSPVQLDQHGNSNISVLGDWLKPRVQLVGSRGLPDDAWALPRLNFFIRKHNARTLNESVDFVCGIGYGERRTRSGMVTGYPHRIVSDLGVFEWDETGVPRVISLHPGVSMDEVSAKTAWEWSNADSEAPTTPAPTDEQLRLIREVIDPYGLRRLDGANARDELWDEIIEVDRQVVAEAAEKRNAESGEALG